MYSPDLTLIRSCETVGCSQSVLWTMGVVPGVPSVASMKAEIPAALLLVLFAVRLLRALVRRVWVLQGHDGPPPPAHLVPILCR